MAEEKPKKRPGKIPLLAAGALAATALLGGALLLREGPDETKDIQKDTRARVVEIMRDADIPIEVTLPHAEDDEPRFSSKENALRLVRGGDLEAAKFFLLMIDRAYKRRVWDFVKKKYGESIEDYIDRRHRTPEDDAQFVKFLHEAVGESGLSREEYTSCTMALEIKKDLDELQAETLAHLDDQARSAVFDNRYHSLFRLLRDQGEVDSSNPTFLKLMETMLEQQDLQDFVREVIEVSKDIPYVSDADRGSLASMYRIE